MCFDADSRPPALPAELSLPPLAGAAKAEDLVLTSADGTEFSAAFAPAAQSHGTSVVILPDVRGLHPFFVELAERFAEAGLDAIAIDPFGRTAGLGPREADWDYAPHVQQTTVERYQQDMGAAVELLRARVTADHVASVGFCFGGFQSFRAGMSDELGLDGVVGFYGVLRDRRGMGLGDLVEDARRIRTPLLGLFGGADEAIPTEDVEAFDAALAVAHEIHTYPGAPHSFFDRKQDEYADESQDAWRRTVKFLTEL